MKHLFSILVITAASACAAEQAAGVPNFHRVNEHLFRGGQPSGAGWTSLSELGIKVVVDLRPPSEHSISDEKRAVETSGMRYVNIPMKGIGAPTDEEVATALELLDSANESIFVHCRRGSDRTGTVIACYRITHDHWSTQKALKEAEAYGLNFLERGMKHYIIGYRPAPVAQPVADSSH